MDISLKLEMILNTLRINMSRVHFFKLAGVMFVACILTGCKADGLEVKLSGKDIASAIDGEEVTVDFEAEFSLFGELDEETKATLDQLLTLSEEYLVLDDVEIVKDDFTTKVLIEGSMPLTINGEEKSPWFIQISPQGEFYSVQLTTGLRYERLAKDMGDINFLLSADAYHPVKFKLRAPGAAVIAPAVEIDGTTHLYYSEVIEKKLTMNFSGGPFDNTGGGFLIKF